VSWLTRSLAIALCLVMAGCAAFQPGRSTGRQIDDFNAGTQIKSAMLRAEGYRLGGIDVEVTEGVALLSGSAPRAEDRIYAECLSWSAPAVREVSNRIEVGAGRGTAQAARDTLITQRVRARLVADAQIRSVNFNVETHQGVVHLLGFARNAAERDRAALHASLADGVEEVVDLVRVYGETPDLPARGALAAAACDQRVAPSLAPPLTGPQEVDNAPLQPIDPPTPASPASPPVASGQDAPAVRAQWVDPQ
jgi:osmotically-inducible protein OsmY